MSDGPRYDVVADTAAGRTGGGTRDGSSGGDDRFAPSTPRADWFRFELLHRDGSVPEPTPAGRPGEGRVTARRGRLTLPHGVVETPCFMPVGTRGTVKGVTVEQLRTCGASIILGNTYHLTLRPGEAVVAALGGLHRFSGWTGPILTDSGGFQIFSLGDACRVTERGAAFRSHLDGAPVDLTPERAVAIQEALGGDIAMVLDHVVGLPSPPALVREAQERSVRWAARCKDAHGRPDQTLFAIVQGGLDADLRRESAEALAGLDFAGYAIGGLSVGESPEEMYLGIGQATPHLPVDRPRYLMGVGRPEDLLEAIRRGVDMFDCVLPTRNGRNAFAFTRFGRVKMRHAVHATDRTPLDRDCPCPACREHSRGYLRHLFLTDEMLGPILLTIHNLTYYLGLMAEARAAIEADDFAGFHERCRRDWTQAPH